MRFVPFLLSIALLGIPGYLEAARSARKVASTVHKVRRGETASRIARLHGLSLRQLAELNPGVRLSRLSVGASLKVKPEPQITKAVVEEARLSETGPAPSLVPPLPVIPANGPTVLVHLERLIPTSTSAVPSSKLPRCISSLTSDELIPIFPPASGLEYESRLSHELGFEPADPGNLDLLWPVETRSISSSWGPRMRTRTVRVVKAQRKRRIRVRYQGSHKGVDLTAPRGSDVYAAQEGRVIVSGRNRSYGNYVILDHGNGVQTVYAHHQTNLVREGDIVHRGQKIAEVGSTGRSTGPHLHFELRLYGQPQNPLPVLNDVEELPAEVVALNAMIESGK